MNLADITPVILTWNEEPNIGRTLDRLQWAREIIVVDSGSTDRTPSIVSSYSNTRLMTRPFDSMASQWNFAIQDTGITSEWILALDADYIVPDEVIRELTDLSPGEEISGYRAVFTYCIEGRPLRASLYPPVTILYRRQQSRYEQDGHTQRITVQGKVGDLRYAVLHDDRKPLSRWLLNQARYMAEEATKLEAGTSVGLFDTIRRLRVVAPFAAPFYALFIRGAILDGKAGLTYAFQRMAAEAILSLELLSRDLQRLKTTDLG